MQIHLLLTSYFISHLRNCVACLGHIYREPWNAALTIIVIGLALALPTGLMLLVLNLQKVNVDWQDSVQISVFLEKSATKTIIASKQHDLEQHIINKVRYVSAASALKAFEQATGQTNMLQQLGENPIPPALIISIKPQASDQDVAALLAAIKAWPEAENVQLDKTWLQRLHALLKLADLMVTIITIVLAAAVFVITCNTIRLNIEKRRKQIIITKLVGATNAFIRREFLYLAFWYALLGSCVSWLVVTCSMLVLQGPVSELAVLYTSTFVLRGLDFTNCCMLLVLSLTLCISAAYVAVGRYLDTLELE